MPLEPSQVLALLEAKRSDFVSGDKAAYAAIAQYRNALAKAAEKSDVALAQLLATLPSDRLGASPLEPLGMFPNWVISANLDWSSREESMIWAGDRLTNISTFAVDGSQIYPSKDLSIPIALIQIGWFENRHLPDGNFDKEIAIDILTPTQLRTCRTDEAAERLVNQRRFQSEIRRLIQYIQDRQHSNAAIAFYDGSLIASFAELFDSETRHFYVSCLRQLLSCSEQYRVPVVAYIDTTYARDLTQMLHQLYRLPDMPRIHDAQLLNTLMKKGDRTPLFRSQRPGILKEYQQQANKIAFCYLKANTGYPVRLEMPTWIYDAQLQEQVIDWVRAEIIIGNGYPYPIETADQVAVLQASDRHKFYQLLQQWAHKEDLQLRLSRKMISKMQRRL